MSESTTGATATTGDPGYLAHFFTSMRLGAASVYHAVLAVEAAPAKWVHDNPAVAPLIQEGIALGSTFLTAHGVPVGSAEVAGAAVLGFLKAYAVSDATVPSAAPVAVPAPPPVADPAPEAAKPSEDATKA